MNGSSKVAVGDITERFFQLEEALLLSADLPLKSLLHLSQILSSLEQSLAAHEASLARVHSMHKLLAELIEQEMFLSEQSSLILLAWLSEARSQVLSAISFYLEPDWSALDSLYKHVEDACLGFMDDGQATYCGVSSASLQQSFDDLLSMADIGYWQIEQGHNAAQVDHSESLCTLSIRLDCALPLASLQDRFPQWHWSYSAPVQEVVTITEPPLESAAFPQEWIEWLHMMASEREIWRSSNTMSALYKAFQQHVKKCHSVSLNTASDGSGGMLEVALSHHSTSSYDEILVIGGRALRLAHGQLVGVPMPISNTALPIYRLQFGEQIWVIPAYHAELFERCPQDVKQGLVFYQDGWQEVALDEVAHQSVLKLQVAEQTLWLFPDAIVREYGTVLQAPYLASDVINIWRVRGDFYQEPNLSLASLRDLVPVNCLLNTTESLFNPGWTRLHISQQSKFYIDNANLVAVLPVDELQEVAEGLVFYSGCIIPYIKTEAGSRRDVALIVRQSNSQAVWALQGRSIEVNQALPEVLVDLDGLMLNLHNGTIIMAFAAGGEFMLNDATMPILHKQLLEIFL